LDPVGASPPDEKVDTVIDETWTTDCDDVEVLVEERGWARSKEMPGERNFSVAN